MEEFDKVQKQLTEDLRQQLESKYSEDLRQQLESKYNNQIQTNEEL